MATLLKFKRKSKIVAAVGRATRTDSDDNDYEVDRLLTELRDALKPILLVRRVRKIAISIEVNGEKLGQFDLVKNLT